MMKVFAQPNGGRSYTNAAGQRVNYQATSRQGRYYERTGTSGVGGSSRTRGRMTGASITRQSAANNRAYLNRLAGRG